MLTTFLELKNHNCTVTNEGKQGLTLIQEEKFDVVLLDLAMPEFDGYAVINALESKDILFLVSGVSSFIIFYMGLVNYLTAPDASTGVLLLIFGTAVAAGTLL